MSSPARVLEYTKTAAAEARDVLAWLLITLVGLGFFQWFLFPSSWLESQSHIVIFVVIEVVVAVFVAWYAFENLKSGDTFSCRIDDKDLTCHCPVSGCGESFRLPIDEIARLEKHDWGDGSCRWYIWDRSGRRYWLTSNYDNPVEQFIGEVRRRVPKVTVT